MTFVHRTKHSSQNNPRVNSMSDIGSRMHIQDNEWTSKNEVSMIRRLRMPTRMPCEDCWLCKSFGTSQFAVENWLHRRLLQVLGFPNNNTQVFCDCITKYIRAKSIIARNWSLSVGLLSLIGQNCQYRPIVLKCALTHTRKCYSTYFVECSVLDDTIEFLTGHGTMHTTICSTPQWTMSLGPWSRDRRLADTSRRARHLLTYSTLNLASQQPVMATVRWALSLPNFFCCD